MDETRARDWDASTYDRVANPQTRWGQQVLDRLDLLGHETVLDAGCGTGRVTEALLDRLPHGRVVAVDASPAMLQAARQRLDVHLDRVRFVPADLLELRARSLGNDHPVDAVFSTATFHWVPDHDRLFANLAAVLRPGGQLVAQCGGHGNIAGLIATARSLAAEHIGTWLYATAEQTRQRLAGAGFDDLDVWTHPEPTRFTSPNELLDFLQTVCLREYLARLPASRQRPFVAALAAAMPEPVIDYVRLNIVARRSRELR